MASIRIECNHQVGQKEAKKRLETLFTAWVDREKFRGSWAGDTFNFEKPGRGTCVVDQRLVRVDIGITTAIGSQQRRRLEVKMADEIQRSLWG
jgi:hypothetical protein